MNINLIFTAFIIAALTLGVSLFVLRRKKRKSVKKPAPAPPPEAEQNTHEFTQFFTSVPAVDITERFTDEAAAVTKRGGRARALREFNREEESEEELLNSNRPEEKGILEMLEEMAGRDKEQKNLPSSIMSDDAQD
jgi:hypothetical protein